MSPGETQIERLKQELANVRERSFAANRRGDFMTVARLTVQTQQINKAIFEAESNLYVDPERKPSGKPLR